jgi:hypothetical protein
MRRGNFQVAREATGSAGTVAGWNRLALQAIRSVQPPPLTAARSLAILHTCMYNAWAAYDDEARQTTHGVAVRLPRAERSSASKASAMSHAAYLALADQFPPKLSAFDAYMAGLALDPAASAVPLSPAGIGRTQASAMFDACRKEGGASPVFVHPPGEVASARLPPGHWCILARRLSERDGYSDDDDVCMYFALAHALSDGAAAAEVLRRFTGQAHGSGLLAEAAAAGDSAGEELGRQVGALVFDKARRYWEGKL